MNNQKVPSRSDLINTLSMLSDDALEYVWRPIMYAYLWTDCHGHDQLTDDDMFRMHLSGMIAHGSPEDVKELDVWRHLIESRAWRHDIEKKRKKSLA